MKPIKQSRRGRFVCVWRGLDGVAKPYAEFEWEQEAQALSKANAAVLGSFSFWVEERK